MTARQLCYKALDKVRTGGYSSITLDAMLSESDLSAQDKAFCSVLFYGTLEKKLLLDYIISTRLEKGKKPDKHIKIILEMGLYQLLFMDSVDDYAAVDESVKLTRKAGFSKLSGFVNAVLRSFIRDGKKIILPEREKDPAKYLSVAYSCPLWIVELWINGYGEENAEKILKTHEGRAPVFARVNTARCTAAQLIENLEKDGVKAESVTGVENAVTLENTGAIDNLKAYNDGLFHVQDLSSQLCCRVLEPKGNDVVLDCCAAPGGKSYTLSQIAGRNARIISCDLHQNRVRLIHNGAKRLGLENIEACVRDAAAAEPIEADRVLCDVPCSGLGIIRRKPDIKNKSKAEVEGLYKLQFDILSNSARSLKPGGVLVYSTCTLNPQENEQSIGRFLAQNPDFEGFAFRELLGESGQFIWHNDYMLTVLPEKEGSDGFFISRIRAKGRN